MKMKLLLVVLAFGWARSVSVALTFLVLMCGTIVQVHATPIVQNFENSWTVDVWDHYGYVAARQWDYQPYVASTDTLASVNLSMTILVSGITLGDDFRYRSSFFTGWSPANYQFSEDEWFYDVSNTSLLINKEYTFTSPSDLSNWTNPLYGPSGNYYFESTTFSNSHSVDVSTQLTYNSASAPVPTPATIPLLGIALAALGFNRKRKES